MNNKLNYGQQIGLQILIAQTLGFRAGYVPEAEKLLTLKPVQPCLLGLLEKESIAAVEWINDQNITKDA